MTCGAHSNCILLLTQLIIYGLSNGAVLALNAIGVTVVYGTVRSLNLAHGDVFALSSVFITTLIGQWGMQTTWPAPQLIGGLALTLLAAMLFGAALNVGLEQLAFRPFRSRSRLAPLIATLGLSFILYQVALIWRTYLPSWIPGDHRSVPGLPEVPVDRIPDLLPTVDLVRAAGLPLDLTFRFTDLFVLLTALLGAVSVTAFLYRTSTGRAIRACAQNPLLAEICGVNLDGAIRRAFAFGGALSGVAAFVFALYYARPFGQHGAQSGLLAFTAALLGGIGNPVGALISGLMLGVFSALSDYFLAAQWTPVLLQALLIGLLIWRPDGLFANEQQADPLATPQRDVITLSASEATRRRINQLSAVGITLALAVPFIGGVQAQALGTGIGVLVILALGLNIVLGLTGLLDLGYAISFGLGGYLTGLLTSRGASSQPIDFLILVVLSLSFTGAFGVLKGWLTLHLRADYLAVVTLALGLLIRQMIINFSDYTGGTGGLAALPPPSIANFPITQPLAQYYLVVACIAGLAWLSQQLIHSRIGLAWQAVSEDELAAASSGIPVARYKLLALSLGSAMAGLAGTLYAGLFNYVSPDMSGFHISAMLLAMVILGGAGGVPGVIMGALLVAGYDRVLIPWLGDQLAQISSTFDLRGLSYFNFGLALYLTIFFRARR